MNVYERRRLHLRDQMDDELSRLNSHRETMTNKDYWDTFAAITNKYRDLTAEVDEAEKAAEALVNVKNTGVHHDRKEQSYVDVVGQLKAKKTTELLKTLASLPTNATSEVDSSDPFYLDKLDPIAVFERWWDEKLSEYPSVAELKDYLDSIYINDSGYLTSKEVNLPCQPSEAHLKVMNSNEINNLLKMNVMASSQKRKRDEQKALGLKMHKKVPLLAKGDGSEYIKKRNKLNRTSTISRSASKLVDVVESYCLPIDLSDLLIRHIYEVCVPMGILKEDAYKPMLEQFLRFEQDPKRRIEIVEKAIQKNWRILSNGTV